MAKKIMQFRYYTDNNSKNQPQTIKRSAIVGGQAFTDCYPITQLGIQALPGTKFRLNYAADPIIIGSTGIYELDLEGLSEINNLAFDAKSMNEIKDIENAFLIIDVICGE